MDALESWEKTTLGVDQIYSNAIVYSLPFYYLYFWLDDKAGMFSYIIVGRSMHDECCIYEMKLSVATSYLSWFSVLS